MDTVLGLSVTATNVQTVLVEGRGGDGATLGHDEFDVFAGGGATTRASEQVAEAVLSIAEADGHRLHSIGVTWSEDADVEAAMLLDSLADLGLANVVAVQSPRAAEALARSIGRMIGYQRTAVCVVEPNTVILSLVDTYDGEVDTVVSHAVDTDEQLLAFLDSVFEREDWRPEGLFVVGSVGGLDSLASWLAQELRLSVFDPPEAELALAHGAALASANDPLALEVASGRTRRRLPAAPLTMLVAGAVTLVVSVSLAVSPHLVPDRTDVAATARNSENAAISPQVPKVVAPPPPVAPALPPEAPPAPEPAAVLPPAAPPEAPVEAAPAPEAAPTIEAIEQPTYQPAAPVAPINPIQAPPPNLVPQVPHQPPRLRDRILKKIPGLNRLG